LGPFFFPIKNWRRRWRGAWRWLVLLHQRIEMSPPKVPRGSSVCRGATVACTRAHVVWEARHTFSPWACFFLYYYLLFLNHPNQGFPFLGTKDCIQLL
jgi:hypothetical protein